MNKIKKSKNILNYKNSLTPKTNLKTNYKKQQATKKNTNKQKN